MKETIDILTKTYQIAAAQIDRATKRHLGQTITQYFSACRQYIRLSNALPTHVKPLNPKHLELHTVEPLPNGVLRAHVVKAEACLQIAILYLLQENLSGYIKCGLNLRRAYVSYSVAWQEYKRMGQLHHEYIDRDTISGIQFGIGSIHLILSSLPPKILQAIAAFGWSPDQHLGFVLLKLCLEDRRSRSPMASILLLTYYTTLTSLCPQLLSSIYTQPAIETLLDAQSLYPNSILFLYFAGRTARLAHNLTLSSQSFEHAIQASQNEWAQSDMLQRSHYELAINHMLRHQWPEAHDLLTQHSNPLFSYLSACCLDMMGERARAILILAQIPLTEPYIRHKIETLQASGYQDMDLSLCALEYLYLTQFLDVESLCCVEQSLVRLVEVERLEHLIRTQELMPETPPPEFGAQRGILLLLKIAVLNEMGRHEECVIHLNWIIDHQNKVDTWAIAYTYWEAGITCWHLGQKEQSVSFWEMALKYTGYDFEHRLSMKASVAIKYANDLGIHSTQVKKQYRLNSSIICDLIKDDKTEFSEERKQSNSTEIVDQLSIAINE
ncbi:unnamed protein product [Rhizopus stolonifer]